VPQLLEPLNAHHLRNVGNNDNSKGRGTLLSVARTLTLGQCFDMTSLSSMLTHSILRVVWPHLDLAAT